MTWPRKNHIPNLTICQTHNGKWIAENKWVDGSFKRNDIGEYVIYPCDDPTEFDNIDELVMAIYEYACHKHIKKIKEIIKYSHVQVKL